MPTPLDDHNKGMILELMPYCQQRMSLALHEAQSYGYLCSIAEAYRSQQREDELYAQGRTVLGPIVTYTRQSNHTKRIAVDIDPVSLPTPQEVGIDSRKYNDEQLEKKLVIFRLSQLENIWRKFGIYRPAATLAFGDYRHFEIYNLPFQNPDSPLVKLALQRRLSRIQANSSPHQ